MQNIRSLLEDTESKLTKCLEYLLVPKKPVPQGSVFWLSCPPTPKSRGAGGVRRSSWRSRSSFHALLTVSKVSSAIQIVDSPLI